MPSIVKYPTVVTQALAEFGDLFANEPERRHFAGATPAPCQPSPSPRDAITTAAPTR